MLIAFEVFLGSVALDEPECTIFESPNLVVLREASLALKTAKSKLQTGSRPVSKSKGFANSKF